MAGAPTTGPTSMIIEDTTQDHGGSQAGAQELASVVGRWTQMMRMAATTPMKTDHVMLQKQASSHGRGEGNCQRFRWTNFLRLLKEI